MQIGRTAVSKLASSLVEGCDMLILQFITKTQDTKDVRLSQISSKFMQHLELFYMVLKGTLY